MIQIGIVEEFCAESKWKHIPAKRLFRNLKYVNDGMAETNRLALTMKGVINRALDDSEGLQSSDYSGYQIFEEGDLVFKLIDLENIKTSRVGLVHERGIMSPAYIRLSEISNNLYSKFYYWYFFALYLNNIYNKLGGGIRQNLTPKELLEVPVPKIDTERQITIANFLDRETTRIDKLIAEKKTFIKLLKEKRQALISHVVTKGLDAKVKMKDSGVEWIGEVPEGWGHGKIKYIARVSNGATPNRDTNEFWDGGTVGWLNSSKVNDIYIENADQFITELAVEKTSVQSVKPNDLVMAITGEGQTRGRVAICKAHVTINQHLAAISVTRKQINVEYLFFWLTSQYLRIRYESSGAGSTKGAITCTDIGCYPVPMPPRAEQELIVSAVKENLSSHDELQRETESSIKFLQEHRTALISAAVTGKIDVRSQVPTSPDRPQPQESAHA